ncbi:P protein-like isoform X2 [Achroia grisella]|uniref:P protein-like isoform X2 n=1 Tax=Achroia grisella TaxID=688607 RepID=UPI0027D2486A|nr:P protein-like isoform X2 [Achroia grisella]XP_059056504.1 P protein-like isoform X2 [Achroia grisella]XP_059056510.1 P protein-like isoform X2 [Achroia grisella]XP_059056518.1 P protein-like isoform X2 [Achroia grisella]
MEKLRNSIRIIRKQKHDRNSVYSMVSGRDLTPGSLEVWVDLPDEIKYDPLLAPFKDLYERHHGKVDTLDITDEDDNTDIKNPDVGDVAEASDLNHEKENGSNGLMTGQNDEVQEIKSPRKTQLHRLARMLKLTVLVTCWGLLTVSLIMNMERSDVVLHTAVKGGEIKEYQLQAGIDKVKTLITLTGPFHQGASDSGNLLYLWLHRVYETTPDSIILEQNSTLWEILLQPEHVLDFSESVTVSNTVSLEDQNDPEYRTLINSVINQTRQFVHENISTWNQTDGNSTKVTLRLATTSNSTVPLTVSYQLDPLEETRAILYAAILLCFLYTLIIFEIVNRTIAALLSSTLGVGVLALNGARPSLDELVSWLDVETLLLLFSMMILVAILAETGLFDYLAVIAFEVTGGRTWPLINCLCFFTAFFSTFLDNVTTVLLMTPVTIRLCEVMQLNPVPVLMSMVIFSNVGGAATPVGDPPNVIIASHPDVLKENINFATFTLHMGLGILLVCVQTYLQLRFIFRDMNKLRHSVPTDIQELRQEIAVWRRAAASLSSYSRDEDLVRSALEKKVKKLKSILAKRECGKGISKLDPKFSSTLAQMKQKYRIRDKQLLVKSTISVAFVVIVFFLHAIPELQRLSLGWTALLGALLLLLLAEKEDLEPILARVEWSTLLFFAALFVLMEVLTKLRLIDWIGKLTESLILKVGEESRLAVAIMLVLWVSGIASAFVDNIPLTTMMVRVTVALADPKGLGLPLAPLAWALSFGACLGGNGTLIGASANVVCAGVAEQHGYRFTFIQFLKIGFPVMLGNLLVASAYLLFCHNVIYWN